MIRTLNRITIVLLVVNLSLAGNSGNGKKDQSTMLPSNVALDPSTGEKVYTDQLMLAFKKGITNDEKQVLVKNFQIKILELIIPYIHLLNGFDQYEISGMFQTYQ